MATAEQKKQYDELHGEWLAAEQAADQLTDEVQEQLARRVSGAGGGPSVNLIMAAEEAKRYARERQTLIATLLRDMFGWPNGK